MVTFADLMTLLLTFFVLLLSMSTLDSQRVKLALGSLRGALGVLDGGGQPREGRKEMTRLPRIAQGEMALMTTIERVVKTQNDKVSNDFIQIGHKDEKVFLSIPDSLLFAPGSTEVLPTAYPFLDDLAGTLAEGSAVAEFIGHADDSAPSGFYASNWEVSAARALSVLQYVQDSGEIDGYRFKASAHGQYLPRSVNDTPAGRASNRRVEIVMTVTSASDRYFYGEAREIREIPGSPGTP
jgi:chemotaxis protein MotB